ncbi:hypothetical protein KDU71_06110 [Carboxylicivirga sediminis]|uniref:Uncharacterized protein n=1 Tax=Carboxylicivirga sediminis TaxID=2006564 RepID=A0A941IX79_9BACT|nr:hypothetical protein [Carboxylicivirga sediminis]MBR8535124.1 hypothetical protein [Carboxylicivirga sediminis]
MASQTKLNIANGWVSIYRSLANSPLWLAETFTRGQAWVDMLLLTNHADGYLRVRGNRVDIKRGQLGWSKTELARRWNWSTGKVRRFFNELEKDKQIVQQKNHLTSIITVVNYSLYQNVNQQATGNRLSNDRQTSPNNKKKKENKVNNENGEFTPPTLETIISFFIENESLQEEAEKFMNHYTGNGWMIGNSKMQNWKSAAKNWMIRSSSFNQIKATNYETNKIRGQKSVNTTQEPKLTRTEQAKRNLLASVAAMDDRLL